MVSPSQGHDHSVQWKGPGRVMSEPDMMDIPELRGCRRRCCAEQLAGKHLAHSCALIDDGQWAFLRLKGEISEVEVVRRPNTDPSPQWTFRDAPPVRQSPWMKPEPQERFNEKAILACCKRTLLGMSWRPGDVRGRAPMFNLDQLTRIHAMVLKGAVSREEFIDQAMQIRKDDVEGWVSQALIHLKMYAARQDLLPMVEGGNKRTD